MSADILLESPDQAQIGELLGKLSNSLGVRSMSFAPSRETRRRAQAAAYALAIEAFKADAQVIAETLGKRYRISRLSFNGARPIVPLARGMVAQALPMPVEAGESQVTVTVTGRIELED